MNPNWLNDQRLNQISPEKRIILTKWISENKQMNSSDILPSLLALNTLLNNHKITFSDFERTTLIQIIKDYMTPSEKQTLNMIQSMIEKHNNK